MFNSHRLADLGVFALEHENRPVSAYDIVRVIKREFGRDVNQGSLFVSLSTDYRFCWAGKGLYGLYRHGLAPGPRNLAGVATLYLFAYEEPLEAEVLAFALKHAGYRFQTQSLLGALARDKSIVWPDYSRCTLRGFYAARRRLRQLGVAPNRSGVDLVAERCRGLIDNAVRAYYERLAG